MSPGQQPKGLLTSMASGHRCQKQAEAMPGLAGISLPSCQKKKKKEERKRWNERHEVSPRAKNSTSAPAGTPAMPPHMHPDQPPAEGIPPPQTETGKTMHPLAPTLDQVQCSGAAAGQGHLPPTHQQRTISILSFPSLFPHIISAQFNESLGTF